MPSKIRLFMIGGLIFLGVMTGLILPGSAAAFGVENSFFECTIFVRKASLFDAQYCQ